MISSIIFSKDRALQLDLLLNSIYKNFPQTSNDVRVIWTASSERFEMGYTQLQSDHPHITFKKQGSDFFYDFYENVCAAHNPCVCMFTDDDILYRQVNFNQNTQNIILNNPGILCYSLRLGLNITHRDIDNVESPETIPPLYAYDNLIIWNRYSIPFWGYWAYPFSVDGHIFRKSELAYIAELLLHWTKIEKRQDNPNELEAKMQRFNCEFGSMMLCDHVSSVINTPNNRVQNLFENDHGSEYAFSQEHCNNLYLSGHRISLDKIKFDNINKAHKELNILEGIELCSTT